MFTYKVIGLNVVFANVEPRQEKAPEHCTYMMAIWLHLNSQEETQCPTRDTLNKYSPLVTASGNNVIALCITLLLWAMFVFILSAMS